MSSIEVDEAVDLIDVGRGSDVVAVLAVVKVCLFAEAETWVE
jgi:hypothetical protein